MKQIFRIFFPLRVVSSWEAGLAGLGSSLSIGMMAGAIVLREGEQTWL
jgi:hypothetical protein